MQKVARVLGASRRQSASLVTSFGSMSLPAQPLGRCQATRCCRIAMPLQHNNEEYRSKTTIVTVTKNH